MEPYLAAPLATLIGAIATAILMWASYNFPAGHNRLEDSKRKKKKKRDEDEDDE